MFFLRSFNFYVIDIKLFVLFLCSDFANCTLLPNNNLFGTIRNNNNSIMTPARRLRLFLRFKWQQLTTFLA